MNREKAGPPRRRGAVISQDPDLGVNGFDDSFDDDEEEWKTEQR